MEKVDITTFNTQLQEKYTYILQNLYFPDTFTDEDKQRFAYSVALAQFNVCTTDDDSQGLRIAIDK